MQEWIKKTNIYEVNLRQYTPEGTIEAFLKHLPRLTSTSPIYKTLLELRSTHPALSSDALLEVLAVNAGEKYLGYKRRNAADEIIVALNFSGEAKNLVIEKMPEEMAEVFTKEKVQFSNKVGFILLPWAFSVWINQSA